MMIPPVVVPPPQSTNNELSCTFDVDEPNRDPSHGDDDSSHPLTLMIDEDHTTTGRSSSSSVAMISTTRDSPSPLPFPWQLHSMLEAAETEGFDHIVSWLMDSSTFKVHKPALFVKHVMPRFFKRQNHYKSFQRQLNLWQFQRFTRARGPCNNSAYFHAYFQRYDTALLGLMKRSSAINAKPSRDNKNLDFSDRVGIPSRSIKQAIKCSTTAEDTSNVDSSHMSMSSLLNDGDDTSDCLLLDCADVITSHQATNDDPKSVIHLDTCKIPQYPNTLAGTLPTLSEQTFGRSIRGGVVPAMVETVPFCDWLSPLGDDVIDGDKLLLLSNMDKNIMDGSSPVLSAEELKYVLVGIQMATTSW